jgi:hypothetical protein
MITLQRDKPLADRTTGILTLPDGTEVPTLELPWRDNQVSISCIPAKIYKFKRDYYGRHQWFSILLVEGRTHIEVHEGSKPEHSEGCILIAKKYLQLMIKWFGDADVLYVLEIKDYVEPKHS